MKYRKDGYCWKKRRDGKTTREDHMKLKVKGMEVRTPSAAGQVGGGWRGAVARHLQPPHSSSISLQCLYGCYVHSSIVPTFHRRCYWLLQVWTGKQVEGLAGREPRHLGVPDPTELTSQ